MLKVNSMKNLPKIVAPSMRSTAENPYISIPKPQLYMLNKILGVQGGAKPKNEFKD